MSQLEGHVKPFLQPFLKGDRRGLDLAGQSVLSTWAVKTAMVLDGTDPENIRGYSQPERQHLRTLGAIPNRTSIWLAASADPSYFLSSKTRHANARDAEEITGVCTTIALASIVVQIFTIRVSPDIGATTNVTASIRRGPWTDATVRVWPPQPTAIWPPPMGLDGLLGLDTFADRFSTTALAEDEIEALAV